MFLSELYKALRKKEILILLVLGIAFDVFMSSKNSVILPQGVNRNVFREYIAKVAGEYTDEKKDFIISERDKYQSYTEQWGEYEEKYRSGEIEPEEYSDFMHNFKEAERKLDTLEYLVSKSLYYEELSKISGYVMYFDDIDVDDYVGNMGIELALVLLLTVIIVNLFGEDFACGTHYMVITSENGRGRLYRARLKCLMIISILSGVLFPAVEWGTKAHHYDLGNMDADIRCLSSMKGSGLNMNIGEYLLLCVVVRTVAAVFYSIIVMAVTLLVRNTISDYVISVALLFLPNIIYEQLGKYLKVSALCRGFAVYQGYGTGLKVAGIHGMVIWSILYGMLSAVLTVMMYRRLNE